MNRPILLVSGGAESVSIAVAEWAVSSGRELAVFSIVEVSVLERVPGIGPVVYAPSSVREEVLGRLEALILRMRDAAGVPVIAFASEDDSLGLLLDLALRHGDQVVACSRCRALAGGGLDKAELFSHLAAAGLGEFIADTRSVRDESDVARAREEFGEDVVIKPASKRWATNLSGGVKTHSGSELQSGQALCERRRDFSEGRAWVAQRRLVPLDGAERSACVVRDGSGAVRYAEVVEWMKYPARGGSACIVETQPGRQSLWQAATAILEAVDAVGVVELSFLADGTGRPRLLELNVRPWLQIDLLQCAGFDVLGDAEQALSGAAVAPGLATVRPATWVSAERIMLKLIRGDGVPRSRTLREVMAVVRRWPRVSAWATRLPGVRWRWFLRNLRRMFG